MYNIDKIMKVFTKTVKKLRAAEEHYSDMEAFENDKAEQAKARAKKMADKLEAMFTEE